MNAINKVLRDCIPYITMSFIDEIPIKEYPKANKGETLGEDGHRLRGRSYERVLQRLYDVCFMFLAKKSTSWQSDLLVVGHLNANCK